jgi:hypothetical protein
MGIISVLKLGHPKQDDTKVGFLFCLFYKRLRLTFFYDFTQTNF